MSELSEYEKRLVEAIILNESLFHLPKVVALAVARAVEKVVREEVAEVAREQDRIIREAKFSSGASMPGSCTL